MHILKPVSLAIAMFFLGAMPAHAEAPWCAYGVKGGGTNCGFYSYEQCMATLSGNAGYCARNPWYSSGARDSRRRQRD